MTQEEKQLLLKDLCARLPYGVKCKMWSGEAIEHSITETLRISGLDAFMCNDSFSIKPYLRPMFSITEEEKIELKTITKGVIQTIGLEDIVVTTDEGFDYLNAHHLDYRGLIPMGLALEAPEDMYKEE